ncbi:MAG: serine hydrolase [Alteromonadaceae bacterium]|nr:serine hydrolase [Alteromonadaceae bacterium]
MSWVLKGNGGINSTLEDMYKWYVALKRNKVLSQSLTDELTSPYILAKDGGPSYYAYGWAIDNSDRNTKIVSHKGGNRVFFHDFIWVQEEDALILFSTNAVNDRIENLAWRIEKMLFNESYLAPPIKKNAHFMVYTHHHSKCRF